MMKMREGDELLERSRFRRMSSSPEEVEFEKKIPSLSVVYGSQAKMICSVKNLGDHQVS